MAQSYSYIREQCVQGVIRASMPNPLPLDRIRAIFDASFFSINSTVAEAFAADENRRELLRGSDTLTFVSGDATLPTNTLKKFTEDATLSIANATYSYRRYPQWLMGSSPQLGLWTTIGETIKAKSKIPVTAFSGSATFTSIKSPDVPAAEGDDFDAPDDYISDFIPAMIQYILSQSMQEAAATA